MLSNIATANKKVEHLTEVRFTVKDLTDVRGLFFNFRNPGGDVKYRSGVYSHNCNKTNVALEKISPQFINSRVSSLSIVASMPFRDYRFINRLYIKLDFDVSILTLNLTLSKIRCANPY